MNRSALFAAPLLVLAVACSGSAAPAANAPTSNAPTSNAPTSTVTAPKQLTADRLVAALTTKVPTASAGITYTASNDPNNLLGRPAGYTSKSTFTDSRIDKATAKSTDPGAVDLGGSIEVFPTNAEAVKRGTYVETVIGAVGFLAHEYDYTSGGALLRLAAGFTPDQSTGYAASLAQVTGEPCIAVPRPTA